MSFRINTNLYAQSAWGNLNQANSKIGESIQKLSSGLRINKAADDASGLAISEKLRGQIRGLSRASMNAQDGISMLQTAEGGMSEITNMIQRMRELSIQAGNGTYTAGDRAELQKEVDQLMAEVDRIATSTEFNTKKLLNGDAAALWSADSPKLQAIVRADTADGNYALTTELSKVGTNTVYGTQVMTLNEDAVGAEIVSVTGAVSANDTNVSFIKDPNALNATGTAYYTVTVGNGTATAAGTLTGSATIASVYAQDGSTFALNVSGAGSANTMAGYVELEYMGDFTYSTAASTVDIRYRFIDAKTGTVSDWNTETENVAGVTAVFTLSFTDSAGSTGTIGFQAGAGSTIQEGDKVLFNFTGDITYVVDSAVSTSIGAAGGGTIQISDGPDSTTGPTLVFTASESLTKLDNGDTTIDYNDTTVYMAEMDGTTGNLDIGNMTFSFKEATEGYTTLTTGMTAAGDFALKINGGGEAATSTTYLKDIAAFTNDDGRNILDNTQTLTLYGNGSQATVTIEGNDTIKDLEQKLTAAIVDGLGMGATSNTSSEASEVNANLVNYVATGDTLANSNESVAGQFIIQSALLGDQSGITFVGDQGIIDGLGLSTIAEGENSALTVTVTDASTGDLIGEDTVTDNMLRNVISGMDVKLESNTGLDITWDSTNKSMGFAALGTQETLNLHVVSNKTTLQVGASEGQAFDVSIFEVSTVGLEIDDISVVNQQVAGEAVTKLDSALVQINGARATIGAQINRLQSTIVNQNTARENLMAAESRIRDLDIANEMTVFTKNQMMVQASTAMLAQANQLPQMAMQLLG